MTEQNIMRGDPNRMYRPSSSGNSGGFIGGVGDGAPGFVNALMKIKTNKRQAQLLQFKEDQQNKRAAMREAAQSQKAQQLEAMRHQNKMEELKYMVQNKKKSAGKKHSPNLLEQMLLTKGKFPAAMKAPKTAKGTPNPFAEYSPDDEARHIANLAQMSGWVPDTTTETPAGHEGGVMGIGGTDVPARTIQTYKPGENANIENAAPETESQPTESE